MSLPAASVVMILPVCASTVAPPPLVKSTSQIAVPFLSLTNAVWSTVLPGLAARAACSACCWVILVLGAVCGEVDCGAVDCGAVVWGEVDCGAVVWGVLGLPDVWADVLPVPDMRSTS